MQSKAEVIESAYNQEVKIGSRKLAAKTYDPIKGSEAQLEFLGDIQDLLIKIEKKLMIIGR